MEIDNVPTFTLDLVAITLGALALGMLVETLSPLRSQQSFFSRWLHNGSLALISYLAAYGATTLLAVSLLTQYSPPRIEWIASLPLWLNIALALASFEFMRYWLHRAMHQVPFLWRLHHVHHSDAEVDVSTAFRHHPFEGLVSILPLLPLSFLFNNAIEALLLYRAWDLVMTVFTHVNVGIPQPLERWLLRVVVTPNFHRTHHFSDKQFTDSNYGATVPWFDFMFKTYRKTTADQQRSLAMGLGLSEADSIRLDKLLLAPLKTQRKND